MFLSLVFQKIFLKSFLRVVDIFRLHSHTCRSFKNWGKIRNFRSVEKIKKGFCANYRKKFTILVENLFLQIIMFWGGNEKNQRQIQSKDLFFWSSP